MSARSALLGDQAFARSQHAPVIKFTSLCTLLTLAAKEDLEVHQMDIKTAYLHSELKEEIYLQPPAGFSMPKGKVWKLIKSVYGLKQAGRVWYLRIKSEFKKAQWAHEDGTILYAAIYVDNIILVFNSMDALLEAKEALKRLFNMSDLGEVHWVLGLEVIRDRNTHTIVLSQHRYVEEILECAGYSDAHPIATPALANEHMAKVDAPEVDVLTYQSGIGSLMYAMLGMHPDLAYTIGMLS
ncbi:hypothetical protein EWM64_g8790 [Hericium alpestre]|uniref:Reverse transcriptase Ty1/copia-type domain-containing protein n=1 Tax=Hericium alpestre TaxID=135208 RepID=A0A4Y9ZKF7_9AGAM|nr:hypothetical protein EWM64_g8790 [Hericium alpestre]